MSHTWGKSPGGKELGGKELDTDNRSFEQDSQFDGIVIMLLLSEDVSENVDCLSVIAVHLESLFGDTLCLS